MRKIKYFIPTVFLSLLLFSCSNNIMIDRFNGYVKNQEGNYVTKKQLKADYYFVFYGASWCPHCVKMKDEITDFYNTYKDNNNFTIIFAGCIKDKSNEDLTKYLKEEEYPFCYVDFDKRDKCGLFDAEEYKGCEKYYIPGFILYDKKGNVLSNSNGPLKSDYVANRPLKYFIENIAK